MTEWIEFLQAQGGQMAERGEFDFPVFASFGSQAEEFSALGASTLLFPLTDRGIVSLRGADTDKLLQGQLSCDMAAITPEQAGTGALCTVKGRMLSNFPLCRDGAGDTLLITHRSLSQNTLDTLKKYAVFYKTTLSNQSDDYRVLGLAGPDAAKLVATITGSEPVATCLHHADITFIQSGPQRWTIVVPAAKAEDLWLQLANHSKPAGLPLWHLLCIREGQGEVRPETVEEFIPQMLNLQHTGAVNFRKGCYTGQEIVARMQYLGKLKRRMYRLGISGLDMQRQSLPAAGAEVCIPDDTRNNGHVVMATQAGDSSMELLAVLTAEAAAAPALQFGDQTFPVKLLSLPYDDQFTVQAQE